MPVTFVLACRGAHIEYVLLMCSDDKYKSVPEILEALRASGFTEANIIIGTVYCFQRCVRVDAALGWWRVCLNSFMNNRQTDMRTSLSYRFSFQELISTDRTTSVAHRAMTAHPYTAYHLKNPTRMHFFVATYHVGICCWSWHVIVGKLFCCCDMWLSSIVVSCFLFFSSLFWRWSYSLLSSSLRYQRAISIMGRTLSMLDEDAMMPVFGYTHWLRVFLECLLFVCV